MSSPLEFWSWSSSIPAIPSPTLFSDEKKERSRKDFSRDSQLWGKVQSQDEIWGQSNWVFSLNDDKASFESRVHGHDDLYLVGVLWTPGSVLSITVFRS